MSLLRWGVIGVGTAGRARAQAVGQRGDCQLVGVHRGRHATEVGAPHWDDAAALLAACDVVAVCSPDSTHPAWAEQGLRAGCHVVVEYPLAGSELEAAGLFELAREVGRVLHVEHIELLANTTRFMAEVALREGPAALWFTSQGQAHPDGRVHAFKQLARLHRWRAVGGEVAWIDTAVASGATIEATIGFVSGWEVGLRALRGPDLRRGLRWRLRARGGEATVEGEVCTLDGVRVEAAAAPGLFLQDTDVFVGRLAGGPTYVDEALVRWGLRAAEALATPGRTEVDRL